MKKRVCLLFLILTICILISAITAIGNETRVEKAYNCLKDKLGNNCGNTKNTQEAAFSLLAMSHDSGIQLNCKSSLKNKEKDDCWVIDENSNTCDLKSTAIAIIALKNIGENINDNIDLLLSKRKAATGLVWFLEIDALNKTECEINGVKFTIEENKKITGSDPSGLSKAYNDYWFEIKNTEKNYTVSCDKSFVTTLIYKKQNSDVYHVLDTTHSAAAYDSTEEKVEAKCFAISNVCDYEGNLWAVLAFAKAGKDISPYVPYIYAMADEPENKKYLPSAFLYMLYNSDDEYRKDLIEQQKQGKFWDESGNKLYDTALAFLALGDIETEEIRNTKEYLLTLQESSGCWKSDTAFLLYSGWQKKPALDTSNIQDCENYNFFCISRGDCTLEKIRDNFYCSGERICCEVKPKQLTCEEKEGIECPDGTECSESEVISADTNNCCLGDCRELSQNDCEQVGNKCQISCSDNQEEKSSYTCYSGMICCADKTSEKDRNWWLIIILIILIILVILAIIFRNKLRIWWFKTKSGLKIGKGPKPTNRPPMTPMMQIPPMQRRIIPRAMIPPYRRPIPRRTSSEKDKEFKETMKKLRDMSR